MGFLGGHSSLALGALVFFWLSSAVAQTAPTYLDWSESIARCQTHYSESTQTYKEEFKWGMTLTEMDDTFERVYQSGGRLPFHANYSTETETFQIYFKSVQGLRVVPISRSFIENVILQIETALDRGYADYVFFPDMGHSHLYIDIAHWQKEYGNFDLSAPNIHNLYRKLLADSQLRPLYHLGEQLQFKDDQDQLLPDELLTFKYWNRNFLGSNDHSANYEIHIASDDKKFNTVSGIAGYHLWSAGFAVQASHKGCFAFRDKNGNKRYFDISLYDPSYKDAGVF